MASEETWHKHWMHVAILTSKLSKDPSTQVGAVLVTPDNLQSSTGYNGAPIGFDDTEHDWNTREIKYEMVIHAEENAILLCPFSKRGTKIYITHQPCHRCMIRMFHVGIRQVYWGTEYPRLTNLDIWNRVAKKLDVVKQIKI